MAPVRTHSKKLTVFKSTDQSEDLNKVSRALMSKFIILILKRHLIICLLHSSFTSLPFWQAKTINVHLSLWDGFSRRWTTNYTSSTYNQENFPFGSPQDSSDKHSVQLGPTSLCELGPIDSWDMEYVHPRRSQGQLQSRKLCRSRPRHQTSVSFNYSPEFQPNVHLSSLPWSSSRAEHTMSFCLISKAVVMQVVLITQ